MAYPFIRNLADVKQVIHRLFKEHNIDGTHKSSGGGGSKVTLAVNSTVALSLNNQGDVNWTDLDLSAYIPATATGVILLLWMTEDVGGYFHVRPNGSADPVGAIIVRAGSEGGGSFGQGICGVDANRKIEYKIIASGADTANAAIFLWGYIE